MIINDIWPQPPDAFTFIGLSVRSKMAEMGRAWFAHGLVDDRPSRLFLGVDRTDPAFRSPVVTGFCRSAVLRLYESRHGLPYDGGDVLLAQLIESFKETDWPGVWTIVVDRKMTLTKKTLTVCEVSGYVPCQ